MRTGACVPEQRRIRGYGAAVAPARRSPTQRTRDAPSELVPRIFAALLRAPILRRFEANARDKPRCRLVVHFDRLTKVMADTHLLGGETGQADQKLSFRASTYTRDPTFLV